MSALNWLTCQFEDSVVNINNTARPYFNQSILLINIARTIQVQFRTRAASTDEQQLKGVINCFSEALKAARDPRVRQNRNKDVDRIFEKAYEKILEFCKEHRIKLDQDMERAIREDRKATAALQLTKRTSENAAKSAKSKGSTSLVMTFWPTDVQNSDDRIAFEFKVEIGTTLNHVLARILQKSMERKKGLPPVNLIQNPGFFTSIPSTLKDFGRESTRNPERSKHHRDTHDTDSTFCQLDFLHKVSDKVEALNLLLDPSSLPESVLSWFDAENQTVIRRKYRNIWRLDEGNYFAAAREISGCLVPLDPRKRVPPLEPPPQQATPVVAQQPRPSKHPASERSHAVPQLQQHPSPRQVISQPQQYPLTPQQQQPISKPQTGFFTNWFRKPTDQQPQQAQPQQSQSQPPSQESAHDIYRSHNAMDSLKLMMVDVPKKKKRWPF